MKKTTLQLARSLPHELEFVDGDYSYIVTVKIRTSRVPNPTTGAASEHITVTLGRACQGELEESTGTLEVRRVE